MMLLGTDVATFVKMQIKDASLLEKAEVPINLLDLVAITP